MASLALQLVVGDADRKHLEHAVFNVCDQLPAVRAFLEKEFVFETASEKEESSVAAPKGSKAAAAASTNQGKKRKRKAPRWAICENCGEDFEKTKNTKFECQYHALPREEVDEAWLHEEGARAPSPGSLAEDPKYPCCQSRPSGVGCVDDTHREDKRKRYHATRTDVGATAEIDYNRWD